MAVKKIETKRNRIGTRYDENKRRFVGFQIDVWIDGKRHRNQTFPTRKEAEACVARLKLGERLNLIDGDVTEIFLAVREKRIGLNEFHDTLKEYFKRRILGEK